MPQLCVLTACACTGGFFLDLVVGPQADLEAALLSRWDSLTSAIPCAGTHCSVFTPSLASCRHRHILLS